MLDKKANTHLNQKKEPITLVFHVSVSFYHQKQLTLGQHYMIWRNNWKSTTGRLNVKLQSDKLQHGCGKL